MCTLGFYNRFEEILVNTTDKKQRDPDMDHLKVIMDAKNNIISILNNRKGIPVVTNKEHDCYLAILIIGHLLIGSNFDDAKKKITGGHNGYGTKPVNISRVEFVVECLVAVWGLKFEQVFWDNMQVPGGLLKVRGQSGQPHQNHLQTGPCTVLDKTMDNSTVSLLSKHVHTIAGSTSLWSATVSRSLPCTSTG